MAGTWLCNVPAKIKTEIMIYTFSERSPWVENYAMFCGIYKEVDLEN